MNFEWDERKRRLNLERHGIDFEDARHIFSESPVYLSSSIHHDELRRLAIGLLDDIEITVVFTMRGENIRLISARRARRNERKIYWANKI